MRGLIDFTGVFSSIKIKAVGLIDEIPLGSLTAPSLVGLCVLLVIFGHLIPRFIYNEKKAEAERWRLAYEAEKEARAISDAQTVELLELAKTTHNIIVGVFGVAASNEQTSGGAHGVVPAKK